MSDATLLLFAASLLFFVLMQVTSVDVNSAGTSMLSSSKDNSNRLWDLRLGKPLRRFKGHQNTSKNFIRSAFGPNERYACCTDDVIVWTGSVAPLSRRVTVLFLVTCWCARPCCVLTLLIAFTCLPLCARFVLVHSCRPFRIAPGCLHIGAFAAWSLAVPKTACSISGTWTLAVSSRRWAPALGRCIPRSGTPTRACWRPVDTTALCGPGGTTTTR